MFGWFADGGFEILSMEAVVAYFKALRRGSVDELF
jgi:hypothetical protein